MTEESSIEKALDIIGQEARYHAIDALACEFHNTWADIAGNTEGSDVEWFARLLYSAERDYSGRWDIAPDEIKERYRSYAKLCIENLSRLTERIAHRYQKISEALRTVEQVERAAYKKKTGQKS